MKQLIILILFSALTFAQSPFLTLMSDEKPKEPTEISFVGAVSKGTLTWTNAGTYDSIYVLRGTSTNPTTIVYRLAGNVTTKLDSPLTGGTIYYYRLQSKKGGLLSDYTSNVSDTILYPELLTNTGFELVAGTADDGTSDNWTDWVETNAAGLITDKTATSQSGFGVKLSNGTGGVYVNVGVSYSNITVTPETNYRFTFYTRGDGTNSGAHRVYNATGAANIVANSLGNNGIAGTSYTLKTVDFTTPAGCVSITVYLYGATANGSVIYYDTVSLKRR